MLTIDQANNVARQLIYHYCALLVPHYNDYIVQRTVEIFAKVVFDEIELYYQGQKEMSSLSSASQFGIAKMISDVYVTFIRPMYESHFKHKQQTNINGQDTEYESPRVKKKSVRINTDANEEFLI